MTPEDAPRDCSEPRALAAADLPACLALSEIAGWNQNDADWRLMLAVGRGWGIDAAFRDSGSRLVATLVVIPYGRFAWISMVLVLPSCRGRGLATTLLRLALRRLAAERTIPVLDATPAGYPVYRQLGFTGTWGFRRYRREAALAAAERVPGAASGPRTRPIAESDWPAILALDTPAFGADRGPLLRALAGRLPRSARILIRGGCPAGYVLGRDGRDAIQIGPLLAVDDAAALALLGDALAGIPGPVYLDLADRHLALLEPLRDLGFALQRPFTRMVLATPAVAPGVPDRVVLVAGPELG